MTTHSRATCLRATCYVLTCYVLTCYVLTCYVLTCYVLLEASIQAPADFSGRWTVEAPPAASTPGGGRGGGGAAARGDMGSGWSPTITIAQNEKELIVESIVYSRSDLQQQPRFVYALDGSETRNTLRMGRGAQVQSSRAKWDGNRLQITTAHTFTDPATGKPATMEVTQTLSLESPTRLVVDVSRSGGPGKQPSTTKTVYTKVEG